MQTNSRNTKENALRQYGVARSNLLLMIILTAVNVVLAAFGSETMLLFSATVPYFVAVFGFVSEIGALAVAGVVIAAVILAVYLVCWIFSKKHYGWMIAALVLFVIDTLAMILIYITVGDFSGILDIVIHIWVLYYLVVGITYGHKLKNLTPEEEAEFEQLQAVEAQEPLQEGNSSPLRSADSADKFRVLAEVSFNGYDICYRRVKRVNELVVNGYVYDDVEMLVEAPHELTARVNGHIIKAGYDGGFSYILVDGEKVKKKLRLM